MATEGVAIANKVGLNNILNLAQEQIIGARATADLIRAADIDERSDPQDLKDAVRGMALLMDAAYMSIEHARKECGLEEA